MVDAMGEMRVEDVEVFLFVELSPRIAFWIFAREFPADLWVSGSDDDGVRNPSIEELSRDPPPPRERP